MCPQEHLESSDGLTDVFVGLQHETIAQSDDMLAWSTVTDEAAEQPRLKLRDGSQAELTVRAGLCGGVLCAAD